MRGDGGIRRKKPKITEICILLSFGISDLNVKLIIIGVVKGSRRTLQVPKECSKLVKILPH